MRINSLRMLLGCAGLATVSWGLPTHALAASCGRPPYASGLHALAVPGQHNAGIALGSGETAPTGIDEVHRRSIVGLWHTVYTSGGMTVQESFDSWYADGNEFEAADFFGVVCQGTWFKTAPGRVRLFHTGWNFDPTGTLLGYFTEIQVDTLSADGMSYDATFALQNFDMLGNHIVGQDLNGTVHATRLTVP